MSHLHDTQAPPADLDVLAARCAGQRYRALVDRGVSKVMAWEEAVSMFSSHHPHWPLPLAEREASRTVGALVLNQVTAGRSASKPAAEIPLNLLVDLATPETAEGLRAATRAEAMGIGAVSVFRGAWKLGGNVRPVAAPFPRKLLAYFDVEARV